MTRETEAKAVLNRIIVAHNRLHRSEITPAEFDQFALKKLSAFADAEAAAMRERAPKCCEDGIQLAADGHDLTGFAGQNCELRFQAKTIRALPATGEVGRVG